MSGISNHEIINFFSKEENEDIPKNFVNIFPSNFITRFTSFHSVMNENGELQYFFNNEYNRFDKKTSIGGVFLILIQEKKYSI